MLHVRAVKTPTSDTPRTPPRNQYTALHIRQYTFLFEAVALAGLTIEQEDELLELGSVPSAGSSWLPLDDFYLPVEALRAVSLRLPSPAASEESEEEGEELLPAWLFEEAEE
ncbi:hypothetical protein Q1695_002266 [Nippostrongylus brasiliensis]|nr:hypothetical protein Q1695_002266 [Nippostrongylus brasiliensis]